LETFPLYTEAGALSPNAIDLVLGSLKPEIRRQRIRAEEGRKSRSEKESRYKARKMDPNGDWH
jgi:hypothetical protein